jgi:hypothetical protein
VGKNRNTRFGKPEQARAGDNELRYIPPPGSRSAQGDPQRPVQRVVPTEPGQGAQGKPVSQPTDYEAGWRAAPQSQPAQPVIYDAVPQQPAQKKKARLPAHQSKAVPNVTVYRPPHVSWGQQMLVEFALYAFAWGLWSVNAFMTIWGLLAIGLPPTFVGVIAGGIIHILITFGERYLIFQGGGPIELPIGLGLGLIDVGTNIVGIVTFVRTYRPGLVGTLPPNPLVWLQELGTILWQLANNQAPNPLPVWTSAALVVIVLATLVALMPEYMVKRTRQRVAIAWMQRPR